MANFRIKSTFLLPKCQSLNLGCQILFLYDSLVLQRNNAGNRAACDFTCQILCYKMLSWSFVSFVLKMIGPSHCLYSHSLSLWFRLFQNVTHYAAFEVWLLSLHDSSRLSCVSVVHLFLWMRTFPCVDRPQHSPKETQAVLVFSDHEKQSDPHTWELLP